jgi:hypothetical protein
MSVFGGGADRLARRLHESIGEREGLIGEPSIGKTLTLCRIRNTPGTGSAQSATRRL